ncbi:unnamed protein product [Pedinophyceae sp. YPF-701]|nr:unnamed protein product [Pedinophyceae sp. YPF-701]
MGKSTVGEMMAKLEVPVHSADAAVHELYAAGGAAVGPVAELFPGVLGADGAIDRAALGQKVLGQPEAMARLEAVVHPLVTQHKVTWLQAREQEPLVVLDVPLMYETGAEAMCDAVAVVSASAEQQRERVLARPGASEHKLDAVLARQVPDAEKRRRADVVIDTGCSLAETEAHVAALVEELRGRTDGTAWARATQGA